jgi:transposase
MTRKQYTFKSKQLTDFQKGKALTLWEQGISNSKIGKSLKTSEATIRNLIKKWKTTGSYQRKTGSGRHRKTTARQDREIVRTAIRNRRITSTAIKNSLNLKVTAKTIRNRLKQANIKSCVAVKKPYVTHANIKKRLQWAKDHKDWNQDKWNSVLFSDESKITLRWQGQRLVWRRQNERLLPECMNGTVKHDKSVMVWGCLCAKGVGDLSIINGKMKAVDYKNILTTQMIPNAHKLFGENTFIFQHDNCKVHTAKVVKKFLQDSNIEILSWPAQSPDLNPIENAWAEIKRRSKDRNPSNETELFQLMVNEWNNLGSDYLTSLISSMPQRCQAVIKNKGYPIKY